MPIWSLTAERLEKLKTAILNKKAEHDDLLVKSEKDLWCADLDEFTTEWDNQVALDAEIQTSIRRMGRRVSKKIGAGRTRKPKGDDDYEPEKKGRGKAKAPAKAETKSSQRFAEMFSAKPKVKKEATQEAVELSDNFSDDDFAALGRGKPAAAKKSEPRSASQSQSRPPSQSVEPEVGRSKRAAASKAKTLFDVTSDSDNDDEMLGDIGAMVKGIAKPTGEPDGRLSLYAMNRPESSHGNGGSAALPKLKTKASKSFDVDSPDDTNYEMLAKSSPHKTAAKDDGFTSDDDLVALSKAPAAKPSSSGAATSKADTGLAPVKKARAVRPAGSKTKAKPDAKPKAAPKATTLSPAAKAYAVRRGVKKSVLDVEDDSDDDLMDAPSPEPKPAARGRPGRAAASRPRVVVDEDSSLMLEEADDDSDDPFEMDDD